MAENEDDTVRMGKEPADEGLKWARARVIGGIGCMMAAGVATCALALRGPRAASADQSCDSQTFSSAANVFRTPALAQADAANANSQKLTETLIFSPSRVQVPVADLKSNPFRQGEDQLAPADAQTDDADRAQREQQRQTALQEVQSLRLETISHQGTKKICTINNVRYHEGQEADGFLVEEIASNIVVLRKGAYRFELKPSL